MLKKFLKYLLNSPTEVVSPTLMQSLFPTVGKINSIDIIRYKTPVLKGLRVIHIENAGYFYLPEKRLFVVFGNCCVSPRL